MQFAHPSQAIFDGYVLLEVEQNLAKCVARSLILSAKFALRVEVGRSCIILPHQNITEMPKANIHEHLRSTKFTHVSDTRTGSQAKILREMLK